MLSPTACWVSGGRTAEPASVVLAEREGTTLPDAFAVQLVHRLRDQDPRITPALTWLDRASGGAGNDGGRGRARRTPEAGCRRPSRCATSSPACA